MSELESRERSEKLLWQEFELAVKEKNSALEEFNSVIEDTPSGLPHPDGVLRMKACSKRYSAARHNMVRAMERLNSFRSTGIVPDELSKKPPHSEARIASQKDEPKSGLGDT